MNRLIRDQLFRYKHAGDPHGFLRQTLGGDYSLVVIKLYEVQLPLFFLDLSKDFVTPCDRIQRVGFTNDASR